MTAQQVPTPRSRLVGLDLARYLAFVGMVVVNFKIVMGVQADGSFFYTVTSALEGRAAATFVALAGIGLGLASVMGVAQTVLVTLKRALFLLVIGLLNMLIFPADILHYYAFYFFFGVLLLPFGNRVLIAAIVALNLTFVVLILTLNFEAGWNWVDLTYSDFWTPTGFVRNLFFNGWHPVIPWLGFFLYGIVLSRLALAERTVQIKLVAFGALAFVFAEGLSLWLSGVLGAIDPELVDLATTQPLPPMPLYTIAGLGVASVVVGVCLMGAGWCERWGILRVITPAGRQTLTLYIAHILIGMGTLEALGKICGQTVAQAVWATVIFCGAATVYALVWARWFKRGPIEDGMRRLAG
ncbi:MAG: hypothetical protein ACI9AX_001579 [Polaromonas sp.]|jgi:uncharacterized protein